MDVALVRRRIGRQAVGLREIARQFHITEGTVKTHVNNLFAKAGLRDRAQAVTYAFRHGLAS